jgi:histidinol-phosphate aminotransferase
LVRENIRDLVPYSSARGEFKGDARIFLDANENAFGSPLEVLYNRYPDPLQTEIKDRIAELENVSPSQIFIGNGSDEAIDILVRVFCRPGIDSILICPPTYGMYEVTAAINDVAVRRVNLTSDFQLDTGAVLRGCDANTKLIFLCSPNNPTGNSLKREAILNVLDNFAGIVVVDEAYIHYAKTGSLLEKLDDHPNLVILQTFSKAWGLAGLRVGLAFAAPDIIGLLNKVKPPYNISQAAQSLILAALGNKGRVESAIEQTMAERSRLERELRRFDLVQTIYPSDANFLLVKVADAAGLYRALLSGQIVVRNRSNVELCDGCLRITVGTPEENTELLRAIEVYETSIFHRS